MSVAVVAKLKVKAGSEKQIEEAFRTMVSKVRGEAGTESYVFHRSTQDSTVFVFYEVYKDQAAFEAHSKTPHFAEMGKALAGNLDGRPQVDILTELARK